MNIQNNFKNIINFRFRHLDTKVRLKTSGKEGTNGGGGNQSPSPERNNRSPKRSPTMGRKSSKASIQDRRSNH